MPSTFVVDRNSTVTVTPGARNRGGFRALPTAFMPDFQVAVARPDQLSLAAQAISLLGQQSPVTLRPRLVSLAEAGGSVGEGCAGSGFSITAGPPVSVSVSGVMGSRLRAVLSSSNVVASLGAAHISERPIAGSGVADCWRGL